MNRFELVNWASVFVASLAGFALGGLWYGPLFSRLWSRLTGIDGNTPRRVPAAVLFAAAWALNFIAASGIALQNGARTGVWFALHVGLMGALFFIAPALAMFHLFEKKPLKLWLVNAGYQVVNFSVMGAIIGAWPR
ncbi:MAG: DUF1761 domain-containing protein [Pseudomonadota bacterium]|jgi:hypothetical protein|nr:MAG: hypothetical protein DIU62_14930 [Pseudomonadota bacterium]